MTGAPKQALDAARQGHVQALISETMLDELKDILNRSKFVRRLQLINKSAEQLVSEYLAYAEVVKVTANLLVVAADPDDNEILACAVSGSAAWIVSGDPHLLNLRIFQDIPIVTVNTFLESCSCDRIAPQGDENTIEPQRRKGHKGSIFRGAVHAKRIHHKAMKIRLNRKGAKGTKAVFLEELSMQNEYTTKQ